MKNSILESKESGFGMIKILIGFLRKHGFFVELRLTEGFEFVSLSEYQIAISYNHKAGAWVIFRDDKIRNVLFETSKIERVVNWLHDVRKSVHN